jgi:hypothetical protein
LNQGEALAVLAIQPLVIGGRAVTVSEFELAFAGRLDDATYHQALEVLRSYGASNAEKVVWALRLAIENECANDVLWALESVFRHRFSQAPYASEKDKSDRDLLAWRLIDELCAWLFYEAEFVSVGDKEEGCSRSS